MIVRQIFGHHATAGVVCREYSGYLDFLSLSLTPPIPESFGTRHRSAPVVTDYNVCVVYFVESLGPTLFVLKELPVNTSTSAGSSATFQCQLGTYRPNSLSENYVFKYHLDPEDGKGLVLAWNLTCYPGLRSMPCDTSSNNDRFNFSFIVVEDTAGLIKVNFTLTVMHVHKDYNNSFFTCSALSNGLIQWEGTAHLTVTSAAHPMAAVVAGSLLLLLVVLSGLLLTGAIVLMRRRKWRNMTRIRQADQGNCNISQHADFLTMGCGRLAKRWV